MKARWMMAAIFAAGLALAGCASNPAAKVDDAAEDYVKLALALDEQDESWIGSYYGPNEWLAAASVAGTPLGEIRESASALIEELAAIEPPEDAGDPRRVRALTQQLTAMVAYVEMLEGTTPASFDEETRRLYDVVLPVRDQKFFRALFDKLNEVLPGDGPLIDRVAVLQERHLEVPAEHLPAVFEAAVEECRRRTLAHIDMPAGEGITFQYVTGQSVGARSIYLGNGQSVMQVDTDAPLTFDAVVQVACHEGYPGHHVQNALLDQRLVQGRGWVEYTVEPMFSSGRLIAEGAANYGVRLAFPGDELRRFKADTLLPLAGIDPSALGEPAPIPAETREQALELLRQLYGVREEVARQYLDGNFNREQALQWIALFGLLGTPEAAAGPLADIVDGRSYLIRRGFAEQYVRWLVEKDGATGEARWDAMAALFTEPPVVVAR